MSIMHPSTRFFGSSFYARDTTVRALDALNARLFDLDDETVAEGRNSDPAVVAQVKDLESQIKKLEARKSREVAAALHKIRQVGSDRRIINQPSQVSAPRAVSGQTAGAQHKTTTGGDSDPEPAAHPVKNVSVKNKKSKSPVLEVLAAAAADLGIVQVRAAADPDPDDLVIPDPCKADPRVLAYGDTSRTRYIRKAISAASTGHHTGRAADFYTAQATASLRRMIRFHLNKLDIYPAPADLVEQAAVSLLLGLVKTHDFSRQPNPNLYKLVSDNIQNLANLREVANRTREGSPQTGVDLLDVEAGLMRTKGPLPEFVLDHYSADFDPQDHRDKDRRTYAQAAKQRMAVGPQPYEYPAITSEAHRVHAREVLEVLEYAARATPTTNAEDDFDFNPLDKMASGNAMDDPFLHTWAQELVDLGQRPADEDDPDGDVRRAIDASGLVTLEVEKVLLMIADLSAESVQDRAPAIFKAMACVEGCDTAQHRADLLRTRAVNKKGKFSKAIQQAAANLLNGAGYSL